MFLLPNQCGLLLTTTVIMLSACGESAQLPISAGIGPHPQLPPPHSTWIPTFNIAEAVGWPTNTKPIPAAGMTVNAFADNLDHPRWLYVLPNGDVLVAETNAPERPGEGWGTKGWLIKQALNKAGEAYGRPVGVALDKQAALLVADDVGNTIWRVTTSITLQQ